MSKINKCIDLSTLPRFGNSDRVSWKDSVGYKINFIYDDVEGFIEITKFSVDEKHNSMLNIRYLNKDYALNYDADTVFLTKVRQSDDIPYELSVAFVTLTDKEPQERIYDFSYLKTFVLRMVCEAYKSRMQFEYLR